MRVFVSDLKAKYGTIDKLNTTWRINYTSWDALLQSREIPENLKDIVVQDISFIDIIKPSHDPDKENAWGDLSAFYTKIAEAYFRISHEEVKSAAPNHLYFGCPFTRWRNDHAVRAGARHCDVIGFDLYENPGYIAPFRLPEGCVDKPVIICEWHVGATEGYVPYRSDGNSQPGRPCRSL